MENNVLITGGSGYLGGTVLNRLKDANLPKHKLYALVRSSAQADAVKQYGAEPLQFDVTNEAVVEQIILEKRINIVFWLIDAATPTKQRYFISALQELKKRTGQQAHFLHTSGAKVFSSHGGAPSNPVPDSHPGLYEIQKTQKAWPAPIRSALQTNNTIIDECDAAGVRSYIYIPCMVYGKGEGFGNVTSIQTVATVRAAKAIGCVSKIDKSNTSWPVCHVSDAATLYIQLLRRMMTGERMGSGRNGYYLGASGIMTWDAVNTKIAAALVKRGVIKNKALCPVDDAKMDAIAVAIKAPKEMVPAQMSGHCALQPQHGLDIGWKPQFPPEHILDSVDREVEIILQNEK